MAQLRSKRAKASEATIPEEENLNSISCEVCRQRKCKCDRKLPFCSQCASEPSKCVYPESGKRGLPLGYLNQLEQRLAETESALYGALMVLRSMGSSTAVQASAKTDTAQKHKAARMEEWSQLPLREWPDMERWMTVMSDQFSIEQPRERIPDTSRGGYAIPVTPIDDETRTSGVSDEPYSGTVPYGWQPGGSRISAGSPYDAHQPRPRMIASPAYYGHQVTVEPEVLPSPSAGSTRHEVDDAVGVSVVDHANAGAVVESRSTRAEELSHNNPSLYF